MPEYINTRRVLRAITTRGIRDPSDFDNKVDWVAETAKVQTGLQALATRMGELVKEGYVLVEKNSTGFDITTSDLEVYFFVILEKDEGPTEL